jgi:hypothetical protein
MIDREMSYFAIRAKDKSMEEGWKGLKWMECT